MQNRLLEYKNLYESHFCGHIFSPAELEKGKAEISILEMNLNKK